MKSTTATQSSSTCRAPVLPAKSAAYVAQLKRNPLQAREFLVRAGIIAASSKPANHSGRRQLTVDAG
jgi:hypothetical protein